jgi:proteic killer suppression protein
MTGIGAIGFLNSAVETMLATLYHRVVQWRSMCLRNDRQFFGIAGWGITLSMMFVQRESLVNWNPRFFRKIQMIDDAVTDQDLRAPSSNHFEKLRGDLEGFCSIRVNRRWRLIFEWDGGRGEARGIYLDDHSYRWGEHVDDEAQTGERR